MLDHICGREGNSEGKRGVEGEGEREGRKGRADEGRNAREREGEWELRE